MARPVEVERLVRLPRPAQPLYSERDVELTGPSLHQQTAARVSKPTDKISKTKYLQQNTTKQNDPNDPTTYRPTDLI